jgi:hypothetical protein
LERALASDDVLAEFEGIMTDWRELRPSTAANNEAVRGGSAIAKLVYAAVGVTVLRWVAVGKSCPYCGDMDGRVVGI